jgi:hypothetical protein
MVNRDQRCKNSRKRLFARVQTACLKSRQHVYDVSVSIEEPLTVPKDKLTKACRDGVENAALASMDVSKTMMLDSLHYRKGEHSFR